MKKVYLIAIAAGFALSARAQKLQKPNIDKISGDTTLSTSEERIFTKVGLGPSQILYAYVSKSKGIHTLVLKMDNNNGVYIYHVTPNDVTNIKFTDGSVLNINPGINSNSDDKSTSVGHRSILSVYYALSTKDIAQLKAKPISYIRIATSAAPMDYEIKEKNGDIIKNELALL